MRRVRQVIMAMALLAACGAALPVVDEFNERSVLSVRVAGQFRHVSREALERAVARVVTGGFFRVDVEAVRAAARELPWVREASVRRVWPDSLHVAIVEREPVATWNDEALLERDGSMFRPRENRIRPWLPRLSGPADSEREVLDAHTRFGEALDGLGGGISSLRLVDRGGWRVGLANGVMLVLGEGQDAATLARFARVAPGVFPAGFDGVEQVDLRYAGGFAVRRTPHQSRGGED